MRSEQDKSFFLIIQLWGKLRRIYLSYFRPGYVKHMSRLRRGECQQCGACCRLVFKCPFLEDNEGKLSCRIYRHRSLVCRNFPIAQQDIAERDKILANTPCGYYFVADFSTE